ncbi:hypothetical protein [Stenotrophomonas maltophilia]|uniref:hypothetical protein n=1 Tax=Stenotrophomonas maltophilia TaxID=40324 RepID=UPI0012DB33B6|nr:hypothetical protein [Stenotrophomonas maltophilia]
MQRDALLPCHLDGSLTDRIYRSSGAASQRSQRRLCGATDATGYTANRGILKTTLITRDRIQGAVSRAERSISRNPATNGWDLADGATWGCKEADVASHFPDRRSAIAIHEGHLISLPLGVLLISESQNLPKSHCPGCHTRTGTGRELTNERCLAECLLPV